MVWREYSEKLKSLLNLEGSPIAVSYSMEPASNARPGSHWACKAISDVALKGLNINISRETSACGGGTMHLGLAPHYTPLSEPDLRLKDFLIKGEKLFRSLTTLHRSLNLAPPAPYGLAKYVVFAPLEKAELEPDLVVFLCNAEQACRLLTLATFPDGRAPRMYMSGSLCYMTITYPIVMGEINVNFGDYTARRMRHYKPDQLFVSIPYPKMPGLMESIPRCSAGTAEVDWKRAPTAG
jgi:uncharacterized protein (DUF169 family)